MHEMNSPPIAPAKINLFLHVGSARADGYHPIESLVAFANTGDDLRFTPGGDAFSIRVTGAYAEASGRPEDNLVLMAANLFAKKKPGVPFGAFSLTKNLPAGAGLGGGSSDAAAALRTLAEYKGLDASDPAVLAAARETGADVAVCVERKARLISGIGEILSEPVQIPALPVLLVYPDAPAATPSVYRAFDEAEMKRSTEFGIRARDIPVEPNAFLEFLMKQNNDLTRAAWRVTPHVAEADATLRANDHALLVRMSGSGSAVFAIHKTAKAAEAEAEIIRAKYPNWWVVATTLR